MNDRHVKYAQFRTILDLSIQSAAERVGMTVEEARDVETGEDWERIVDEAKSVESLEGLRLAGRQAIFEAVTGQNEDLPEHTRLQIAKWALGRIDDQFMSPEFRNAQDKSNENPLEGIPDEKLRELRDEFEEEEDEEEVVLSD